MSEWRGKGKRKVREDWQHSRVVEWVISDDLIVCGVDGADVMGKWRTFFISCRVVIDPYDKDD